MGAYLDNAATTKVYKNVADIVEKVLVEDFANPSSLYNKGLDAEKYIRNTKEIIAGNLKVEDKEIILPECHYKKPTTTNQWVQDLYWIIEQNNLY